MAASELVSRRLLLIEQLPASALEAVRAGWLSTWSAQPGAGALGARQPQHAQGLVAALKDSPLTSRNCSASGSITRSNGRAPEDGGRAGCFLNPWRSPVESPEGRWCRDLRTVEHILLRLINRPNELLSPECSSSKNAACFHPLRCFKSL